MCLAFSFFYVPLQRTVIVPPEAGYGQKGMNEIPVNNTFLICRMHSLKMRLAVNTEQ